MNRSRAPHSTVWFVLAVEEDDAGDLHGTIESTRGDLHVRFASGRELLEILAEAAPADGAAEGRDA